MTSREKVNNCFELKPIKDRREIPIFPMYVSYPGIFAGITQKEMIDSPKKWMEAVKKTYDHFGKPDISMGLSLGDVIFAEGLEARRPGYELEGDNEQFQFIESARMDHDDYRDIIANGWAKWFNKYMCSIQHPPFRSTFRLIMRWIQLSMNCGKVVKFLNGMDVEAIQGTAEMPMFDRLSLTRSFTEFCVDLYTEPGLILEIVKKETPNLIKSTLSNVSRSSVKRIQLFPMRSDANSLSPDMFAEFSFPYLKQMIEAFHAAGYRTVLHTDGNWIPMLDRFVNLPKASVHFEFDGLTDMFKASEIIGGWHSFRGDVPATMLAFGKPDEVSEYCEKLITGIGMKGGFVLGSGCEVPMNTKPENLMAMMNSLK